jgi:hypothetical protein
MDAVFALVHTLVLRRDEGQDLIDAESWWR